MKRYIHEFRTEELTFAATDVLVVGAGIAGLWTALHIDPTKKVTVIAKYTVDCCNSWLAQGGVAGVVRTDDCFESHIEDTLKAGAGLCNEDTVRILVREAPTNLYELVDMQVPFDRDEAGELSVGREGGHSCRRILHSGGDATGKAITQALLGEALKRENIRLIENTRLCEILTDADGVVGAVVRDDTCMYGINTPYIVMASGGIGHLYRYTTNPRSTTGDGIACAHRAGASTSMMEMVQFHPTTLMSSKGEDKLFLISEAVRGEGAVLRNGRGERFMEHVHPMKDLAPRDIVTRGILADLTKTGDEHADLDVSCMSTDFFARRFPTIYGKCRSYDINLTEESIPVHPAQHYFMGGISTDYDGMTNVPGLFAVGECAWSGVHGANRLASNSMLECLVFGRRAATAICKQNRMQGTTLNISNTYSADEMDEGHIILLYESLRALMDEYVGPIRTRSGLHRASVAVRNMIDECDRYAIRTAQAAELYSMLSVAALIVDGAMARPDSVGAHYMVK